MFCTCTPLDLLSFQEDRRRLRRAFLQINYSILLDFRLPSFDKTDLCSRKYSLTKFVKKMISFVLIVT